MNEPTVSDRAHLRSWIGTYQLREGDTIELSARAGGLQAAAHGCWAEYLLAGGTEPLPPNAKDLRARTLPMLLAANRGDFGPLSEFHPSLSAKVKDKQIEYIRRQVEMGGPFLDAEIARVPFEGQLKVVVRMNHEQASFYRWLRLADGRLSGFGLGESLPGGPEEILLFPTGPDEFTRFALDPIVPVTFRFSQAAGEEGRPRLRIQIGQATIDAPRISASR